MAGVRGRSGGARRGSGAKPFRPIAEHRDIAEMGAALGLTAEDIALKIVDPRTKAPISAGMVKKYFALELERGLTTLIYQVGSACIKAAKNGNVEAQKFLLTRRAKWTEAPLNVNSAVDLKVSVDDARQRAIDSIREAFQEATGEQMPPGRLN